MSLEILVNMAKCPTCTNMVLVGRYIPKIPRRCNQCKNREQYQKRKIILKVRAHVKKKCHSCGGMIKREGVYCSEYCKWIGKLKTYHYKIPLRVGDL